MQNLNWLSVNLHVPPVCADAISDLLFDLGAEGVWEDNPDGLGRVLLRAGFPADSGSLEEKVQGAVEAVAQGFALPLDDFYFDIILEKNHDWAEKWKEGLAPVLVDDQLLIAPTWIAEKDYPQGWEKAAILKLDPGMAFGTGQHATTYLCLRALVKFFQTEKINSVLDVGFGSGILAIAAKLLKPQAEIYGVDNDPETIAVAEGNANLNATPGIHFSLEELSDLSKKFDLIVANITQNPLLELADGISQKIQTGGILILSGLLENQGDVICASYEALGFKLLEKEAQDEWLSLIFRKGN